MEKRVVIVDNYDSFTYNIVQYLEELGARCTVRLNDQTSAKEIAREMPHGIVLSPGPASPDEAGVTLEVISELSGKIPLLGICLGHQAIGQSFGAVVRRAASPVHGRASRIVHEGTGVFSGLPSPMEVARYHSLVVDSATLPAALRALARAEDGELMAFRHVSHPTIGLQFHPESILSQHGHALFQHWLNTL